MRSRFVKDEYMIDTCQRGEHRGSRLFVDDWAAWAFEFTDAAIAVDGDNQHIAECGRFLEITDVPDVQQVETVAIPKRRGNQESTGKKGGLTMKNVITKLLALVTMAYLLVPEVPWAA